MASEIMSAQNERPAVAGGEALAEQVYPPINFVYQHLHDALRRELDSLSATVRDIESRLGNQDVLADLHQLQDRYHLLVQVNRYHSSVEDEVSTLSSTLLSGASCIKGTSETSCGCKVPSGLLTTVCSVSMFQVKALSQVVYPALEQKVSNVTHSYTVEHGEEVCFNGLSWLLHCLLASMSATRPVAHSGACSACWRMLARAMHTAPA